MIIMYNTFNNVQKSLPLIAMQTTETMEMLRTFSEFDELSDNELLGIDITYFGFGDGNRGAILVITGQVEVIEGQRVWIPKKENYIELSPKTADTIMEYLEFIKPTLSEDLELPSARSVPITVEGGKSIITHQFLFESWHEMMLMQEKQIEKAKIRRHLQEKEKSLEMNMDFIVLRG